MEKYNDLEVADKIKDENELFFYNQSFYNYDENFWKPISIDIIKNFVLNILQEDYKQQRVNNIIDILKIKTKKISTDINKNDKDVAINIFNGHYYLMEKKLVSHNNKTRLANSINIFNVNYNKDAKCERWERFVIEIFEPDYDREDKIKLLQEYLGYCLTQNVHYQKALLLLGSGANGKSKIIEVMQRILGKDNYSNIELHQFSKPSYVVELQNKLVNFCSEIDYKNKFSSGVFKRIVTGETLTGDAKFKNPIKFEPYCKLVFGTNDLPFTSDTTKGYFRRLLILKFNRSFEGNERDENLLNDLYSEIDGIFKWILEGLHRLYKQNKFTIPESHKTELRNYIEASNNIVLFINENIEITANDGDRIGYQEFYEQYVEYTKDEGSHPYMKTNFKKELEKQFPRISFHRSGNDGRHFRYVRRLPQQIDDSTEKSQYSIAPPDNLPF